MKGMCSYKMNIQENGGLEKNRHWRITEGTEFLMSAGFSYWPNGHKHMSTNILTANVQ